MGQTPDARVKPEAQAPIGVNTLPVDLKPQQVFYSQRPAMHNFQKSLD